MPKQTRVKTKYPGVYYINSVGARGAERTFYIVYRLNGKLIEEKAGHATVDAMTEAKANNIRASRLRGKEQPNTVRRAEARAKADEEDSRWTFRKLWYSYSSNRKDCRGKDNDRSLFNLYLGPIIGEKEPHEIIDFDVKRVNKTMEKLKPQSKRHVLELLHRLVNYGLKNRYSQGLRLNVKLPKVDNQKLETLSPEQLSALLQAINESDDLEAANIMKMALFTGMRRGELFKLKWTDIDFDRGFIHIIEPKGGVSQTIPMNEQARHVLENHPRTAENVFTTHRGKQFVDISRRVNPIKKAAGIGPDFRALHGLRHVYASMLASSGEVDMYTLQKLLTHKSPIMTQRYAHLRDETLKKASSLAGDIIEQAAKAKNRKNETVTA